jgi:DNA-binding NtrC family response regulator
MTDRYPVAWRHRPLHSFSRPEQSAGPRSISVLVVDADALLVREVVAALRQEGLRVVEARTFLEAKRVWESERPSALIVDITLGDFNGLQLLMRARDAQPDVRAVVTCAFPDPVLEAETRRLGGTFMLKPVDPARVLAALGPWPGLPLTARDADHVAGRWQERRVRERREHVITGFSPERRTHERRRITR